MIEKSIELKVSDIHLINEAIKNGFNELYGWSPEHKKHIRDLFHELSRTYTTDKNVRLIVWKEPLLR